MDMNNEDHNWNVKETENNIRTYQNLPIEIRQRIHKDYFAYKKKYEYWKANFENYLFQIIQDESQIVYKGYMITSAQHNLTNGVVQNVIQQISMKYDQHYIMGSLKELKYYNGGGQNALRISSIYNENLCPFHFEISLPFQLNQQNFHLLKQQFHDNHNLNKKLKKLIDLENRNSILLRDISDPNYETYVTLKQFVQLNEAYSFFALETQEEKIKYFSVKNNQQFKFVENQDQELIFVVGVENQNNINRNISDYISEEFSTDEEKLKKYALQQQLKKTEQELKELQNALLIKINIFNFSFLVYPRDDNSYFLRNEDVETLDYLNDYLQQIDFYQNILGQLKFEQKTWKLNQFNQNNQFIYQKVNRYPEFFQLRNEQTILVRSKKANLKIHITSVDIQQNQ